MIGSPHANIVFAWAGGPISSPSESTFKMRLVQFVCDAEDEEEYRRMVEQHERDKMVRSVDWKVYADDVLQKVDEQLVAFGLEVIEYEHGGDYYEWHIERRIPGTAAGAGWREKKALQKEAVQFFSDLFGWDQEHWDARSCRGKEEVEPWREERRRQFAALKADLGRDEKGTTGPPGVLLTEKQ